MHSLAWLDVEPGQTALQIAELVLALFLSSLIGLERELRMKSAGLRTHALVGVSAALIMLVSKYGFTDILSKYEIVLDPSRVAAQIVSGIGFIGGGLIFVQRDIVRGLTTAAIIWLTAAVGMACGAGLPLLAIFVTGAHFLVVYGYTPFTHRFLAAHANLLVCYVPGKGAVQEIIQTCTGHGFSVHDLELRREGDAVHTDAQTIRISLQGRGLMTSVVASVGDIKGVVSVQLNRDQQSSRD
jgi:putative Mg2+ transporter-C (MgtC) family protein